MGKNVVYRFSQMVGVAELESGYEKKEKYVRSILLLSFQSHYQ